MPDRLLFRKNKKETLKSKYQGVPGWWQFTDAICRSAKVKSALHAAQGGRCADCHKDIVSRNLDDAVVHHLSYDHRCTFGGNATQNPDCGVCISENKQKSDACLRLLRLMHTDCHEALHTAEEHDPKWRSDLGLKARASTQPPRRRRFHAPRSAGR